MPIDWRLLIDRCDAQGTLPLLSRALHLARPTPVPPEFLAEIHEKAAGKRLRSLGMAGELARIPPEVWREVDGDPVARAIAEQFVENLASDVGDYGGAPGGAMLHLRMLETLASKARYLWRRALQPNHLDADFIRLPDSLAPAYYLIRPLRVACKAVGRLRAQ